MFGVHGDAKRISPFLLLDYAAPTRVRAHRRAGAASASIRTAASRPSPIVYAGRGRASRLHRRRRRDRPGRRAVDDRGQRASCTRSSTPRATARSGGPFEMVQLWVNLPAKDKMTAPGYQAITDAQIPAVALPDDAGHGARDRGRVRRRKGPGAHLHADLGRATQDAGTTATSRCPRAGRQRSSCCAAPCG